MIITSQLSLLFLLQLFSQHSVFVEATWLRSTFVSSQAAQSANHDFLLLSTTRSELKSSVTAPSDSPSLIPSIQPSSAAFFQASPSDIPSLHHSDSPSRQKTTVAPSDTPSLIPSIQPSLFRTSTSDSPSFAPSDKPSGATVLYKQSPSSKPLPSDSPSSLPSAQPSWLRAVVGSSDFPSLSPSAQPSWKPILQTPKPPIAKSLVPLAVSHPLSSDVPSSIPSVGPSLLTATVDRSGVPSLTPSVRPSDAKSVAPSTLSRAPSSVPIKAPVTSASAATVGREFNASDVITLTGVTAIMDKTVETVFEKTTASFLTKYTQLGKGVSNITVESVTVLKQVVVNGTRRRLQPGGLRVDFSVVAVVFANDHSNFSFANLVKSTFDLSGPEFLGSLSAASPFFTSSSYSGVNAEKSNTDASGGNKTIYVSVAAVTVSAALALTLGLWVYRRSLQRRKEDGSDLDTSAGYISPYPSSTDMHDATKEPKMLSTEQWDSAEGTRNKSKDMSISDEQGDRQQVNDAVVSSLRLESVRNSPILVEERSRTMQWSNRHRGNRGEELTASPKAEAAFTKLEQGNLSTQEPHTIGKSVERRNGLPAQDTERKTLYSISESKGSPKRENFSENSFQANKARILPPALKRDPPVGVTIQPQESLTDDELIRHLNASPSLAETTQPRRPFSNDEANSERCQAFYLCGLEDEIISFHEPPKVSEPSRRTSQSSQPSTPRDAPPSTPRRDAPPSTPQRDALSNIPLRAAPPNSNKNNNDNSNKVDRLLDENSDRGHSFCHEESTAQDESTAEEVVFPVYGPSSSFPTSEVMQIEP